MPVTMSVSRWLADGSLLYVSDGSGWFQVVRRSADGRDRVVLTDGEREHGDPSGGYGYAPLPSPDGERVVHIEVRDGLIDLVVRGLRDGTPPKRGRWSATEVAAHDRRRGCRRAATDHPLGRGLASGRLAAGWGVDRRHRRERDATTGPVAAPGAGRST